MIGQLAPLEWLAGHVLEPFVTGLVLHRNYWGCFIAELWCIFRSALSPSPLFPVDYLSGVNDSAMQNLTVDVDEDESGSETSRCFVPEILIDYLNQQVGKDNVEPGSFFLRGVCLLVDISGFTKLSGDFCAQGKSGIDGLQLATNGYMGLLVETIYAYGGDIIKFAGDAIICIFPATLTTKIVKTPKGKTLRRSMLAAALNTQFQHEAKLSDEADSVSQAAQFVRMLNISSRDNSVSSMDGRQSSVDDCRQDSFERREKTVVRPELVLRAMECADHLRKIETDQLTVHVAMTCGEMCFGILGGYEERWECLISGPCLQELSACLDDAPSKTAVISADCFEILQEGLQLMMPLGINPGDFEPDTPSESLRSMPPKLTNCHLAGYKFSLNPLTSRNHTILSVCQSDDADLYSFKRDLSYRRASAVPGIEMRSWVQDSRLTNLVLQYVPVHIAEGLSTGTGLNYLAEIREVTTMFMKWDSYDPNGRHRNLVELQACFFQAQKILHSTGAFLRQFLVDDKGCVLIACWGMPSHSYLDNAQRALTAAVSIHGTLPSLGMHCSFGITTGDVYCGTVGSALRMEYAAIGSVVNMSARLMGKANGSILLDDNTFARLPNTMHSSLVKCLPINVKGRVEPIQVYEYSTIVPTVRVETAEPQDEVLAMHPACTAPFAELVRKLHSSAALHSIRRVASQEPCESPVNSNNPKEDRKLQVLLVEGQRGTGRKASTAWLSKHAVDSKIPTVHVKLTEKCYLSSYFLLYSIFCQCAPKDIYTNSFVQRRYVHALLREMYPDDAEMAMRVAFPTLAMAFALTCTYLREDSQEVDFSLRSMSSGNNNSTKSGISKSGVIQRCKDNKIPQRVANDVLCKLMRHLLRERTVLVIIDDIQFADDESLRVIGDILQIQCKSALVMTSVTPNSAEPTTGSHIGSTRPRTEHLPTPTDYLNNEWLTKVRADVLTCPGTSVAKLNMFTNHEISKLLATTLGMRNIAPRLVHVVSTLSGGGFYLVKEILQCIRETGPKQFLDTVGDAVQDSPVKVNGTPDRSSRRGSSRQHYRSTHGTPHSTTTNHTASSSPKNSPRSDAESSGNNPQAQTLQRFKLDQLVVCRYENLTMATKHVLRTASILGPAFSRQVLYGVLPRILKPEISGCLVALVQQQWLQQVPNELDSYEFKYDYTHRIVYEITPESERRHMHRTIAKYLEELSAGDPAEASQLAHHFGKCETDKALYYTYQAAVHILLKKASFELCDCLDMLFIAVDFCSTVYDVEVLLRVGSDATAKTEAYESEKHKLRRSHSTVSVFTRFFCCVGTRSKLNHVTPMNQIDTILEEGPVPGVISPRALENSVRSVRSPKSAGSPHSRSNHNSDALEPPDHIFNNHHEDDNNTTVSFNTQARNYFAEKFQELRTLLLQRKREVLLRNGNPGKIKEWQMGILGGEEVSRAQKKPGNKPRNPRSFRTSGRSPG